MNPFDLQKTDKKLAILVDPDKHSDEELLDLMTEIERLGPDYIFIGGSLIYRSKIESAASLIKSVSKRPLVLFPGHFTQLTDQVDAVLLLSLISGRNADMLIGQHVLAAPKLRSIKAQIVSTGYMLIDGGKPTSVTYMSNTQAIPRDKNDIALCTAMAGELLGMKLIYMDAGSGAALSIPHKMVREVADGVSLPIIVGGGIKSLQQADAYWQNGANLIVIGNAFEEVHTQSGKAFFGLKEKDD